MRTTKQMAKQKTRRRCKQSDESSRTKQHETNMGISEKPANKRENIQKTQPSKKPDGTYTQNTLQTMERWTEWIKENSQTPPETEHPEISHIEEKQWRKIKIRKQTKAEK